MPEPEDAFLVNADSDPVQLVVNCRACFQNASPIKDFFDSMIRQGRRHFIVDLEGCKGMDSTFLGILAGTGIELSSLKNKGELTLIHLDEKNLDSVRSLGLDHLVTIDTDVDAVLERCRLKALKGDQKGTESSQAKMALDAHKNLIKANKSNRQKFKDVIQFLEDRSDG